MPVPAPNTESLEWQLCEVLIGHCGERGDNEGALETLERIIRERDDLFKLLSISCLKAFRDGLIKL